MSLDPIPLCVIEGFVMLPDDFDLDAAAIAMR
jgi:hypothetical protein